MKHFVLWILKIYQKFLTPIFGYGSCRYYPTCSEYARWQFVHNNFFKAIVLSILRILRCNQLFAGGIDYPILSKKRVKFSLLCSRKLLCEDIVFWLVPKNPKSFYLVKAFKSNLKKEHRD